MLTHGSSRSFRPPLRRPTRRTDPRAPRPRLTRRCCPTSPASPCAASEDRAAMMRLRSHGARCLRRGAPAAPPPVAVRGRVTWRRAASSARQRRRDTLSTVDENCDANPAAPNFRSRAVKYRATRAASYEYHNTLTLFQATQLRRERSMPGRGGGRGGLRGCVDAASTRHRMNGEHHCTQHVCSLGPRLAVGDHSAIARVGRT